MNDIELVSEALDVLAPSDLPSQIDCEHRIIEYTRLEKQLEAAKSIADVKKVSDAAEAIAHAAKRIGADRAVCNQATDIFIRSKRKLGVLLGPPPGKAHGQTTHGKVASHACEAISKDEVQRCRHLAWKVPDDIYGRYANWVFKHADGSHLALRDVVVISRVKDDLQDEVISHLEAGRAESIAEAVRLCRREEITRGTVDVPVGQFRTIVMDPPWQMEKISREEAPNQEAFDYQTMSVDQIRDYWLESLPAADECHLYLWTTQKFLPHTFSLLDAWGFSYVFTMVWHKAGGFQPVGLPQYNCEFVVFGRRGGLPFLDTKAFNVCFDAKRSGHSRKPDEFFELVSRVSPEPRISIYERGDRTGFQSWGLEA
jgi:N6-adenosine-specific RNA methylase IME4